MDVSVSVGTAEALAFRMPMPMQLTRSGPPARLGAVAAAAVAPERVASGSTCFYTGQWATGVASATVAATAGGNLERGPRRLPLPLRRRWG